MCSRNRQARVDHRLPRWLKVSYLVELIKAQTEHSLEFIELLLDMGKQERITGYEVLVLLHLYNRGVTVMSCHA